MSAIAIILSGVLGCIFGAIGAILVVLGIKKKKNKN